MIDFKDKKDFKEEAHIFKVITLGRIKIGTPISRIENELKRSIELERYGICEGLTQALNIAKEGGINNILKDNGECVASI